MVGGVVGDAGDAGRAVVVACRSRGRSRGRRAACRSSDSTPRAAAVERLGVAVGRVQVAQRIEGQAERVDLPVRELLDVRAVGPEAVRVARLHRDRPGRPAPSIVRGVGEAVAGVDPAVDPAVKAVGHAVRVAEAERAVQHLAALAAAVAVGVAAAVEVGDAVDDRAVGQRQDADGDVEAVGERGDPAGAAVASKSSSTFTASRACSGSFGRDTDTRPTA